MASLYLRFYSNMEPTCIDGARRRKFAIVTFPCTDSFPYMDKINHLFMDIVKVNSQLVKSVVNAEHKQCKVLLPIQIRVWA